MTSRDTIVVGGLTMSDPLAGIGIFDHWAEDETSRNSLEGGIGIFDHWLEDEVPRNPLEEGKLFQNWLEEQQAQQAEADRRFESGMFRPFNSLD